MKLKHDKLLSSFAFNCKLRHYTKVSTASDAAPAPAPTRSVQGVVRGRVDLSKPVAGVPALGGWGIATLPIWVTSDAFEESVTGVFTLDAAIDFAIGDPRLAPIVRLRGFARGLPLPCAPGTRVSVTDTTFEADLGMFAIHASNLTVTLTCGGGGAAGASSAAAVSILGNLAPFVKNLGADDDGEETSVVDSGMDNDKLGVRLEFPSVPMNASIVQGPQGWYWIGRFSLETPAALPFYVRVGVNFDTKKGLPASASVNAAVRYNHPKLNVTANGSFPLGLCDPDEPFSFSGSLGGGCASGNLC